LNLGEPFRAAPEKKEVVPGENKPAGMEESNILNGILPFDEEGEKKEE
jgi:hypothetical protein